MCVGVKVVIFGGHVLRGESGACGVGWAIGGATAAAGCSLESFMLKSSCVDRQGDEG